MRIKENGYMWKFLYLCEAKTKQYTTWVKPSTACNIFKTKDVVYAVRRKV
jgi:hypothetical protein